jgi:hypothetical protein
MTVRPVAESPSSTHANNPPLVTAVMLPVDGQWSDIELLYTVDRLKGQGSRVESVKVSHLQAPHCSYVYQFGSVLSIPGCGNP